jgi:hypothetical protein
MIGVRRVGPAIRELLPDPRSLGGEGRNIDRSRLVTVLEKLAGELHRAYWARVGLVVLIAILLAALSLRFAATPFILHGLYGGVAITFCGAIVTLKQVSDEMARVRLLLGLAGEVSLESLTEIARRVAEEF